MNATSDLVQVMARDVALDKLFEALETLTVARVLAMTAIRGGTQTSDLAIAAAKREFDRIDAAIDTIRLLVGTPDGAS